MERTPLPPAAEALFRAHHDRSTGWLTLVCGGREAKLYLQHGDLVGARLGFGYQTAAQALLAAGELVPPALDLLWSRGELGDAQTGVHRSGRVIDQRSLAVALAVAFESGVRGQRAIRERRDVMHDAKNVLPPQECQEARRRKN